ncbi:MAG: hypothetical protein ACTSRZ_03755 [Promethearchaeota archaeon]
MGFVTTIIIIFFLGYSCHYFVKPLRPKHKGAVAWWSALSTIIPLIVDILIYNGCFDGIFAWLSSNISWYNVINGKDYMFNTILGFIRFGNIPTNAPGLDGIAILIFISYFPWYSFAKDGGKMMYGWRSFEGGFWWALKPIKKPKGGKKQNSEPK